MVFLTGEVFPALHGPIVLALGFIQDDTDPLPRGKQGGTNIGHSTAVPLPDDFHSGAHLQGLAAAFRAHPGAGAGCLQREEKSSQLRTASATRRNSGLDTGAPFPAGVGSQHAVPPSTLPDAEGWSLLTLHRPSGVGEMPSPPFQLPTGITDSSRTPDCSSQQARCTHTRVVHFVEDRGAAPERAELRG